MKFSYVPITSKVTVFALATQSVSVCTKHQIMVVGMGLDPLEHWAWAFNNHTHAWQTTDVDCCVVREWQGFICESNILIA